jgi:hypothetical protein
MWFPQINGRDGIPVITDFEFTARSLAAFCKHHRHGRGPW